MTNRVTLLVTVDVVSAFCRAIPDVIAQRIADCDPSLRPVADWFRSFMRDKKFFVSHEGKTSTTRTAQGGVGQGTNSAPILWAIFIDELQRALEQRAERADSLDADFRADLDDDTILTRRVQYDSEIALAGNTIVTVATVADDVNFWVTHSDPARCMAKANSMLTVVHDFCSRYGLSLSKVKAGFICGVKKQHDWYDGHIRVLRCGRLFEPFSPRVAKDIRLLGVNITGDFQFKGHIADVATRAHRRLAMFALMRRYVPAHVARTFYESCVLSPMLHGCEVWGPFILDQSWALLNTVHAAGARLITGCLHTTRNEAVMREANLRDVQFYVEQRTVNDCLSSPRLVTDLGISWA